MKRNRPSCSFIRLCPREDSARVDSRSGNRSQPRLTPFRPSRPHTSQTVGLFLRPNSTPFRCAQERTRTSNPLRELAPQASAYTNSATWANGKIYFPDSFVSSTASATVSTISEDSLFSVSANSAINSSSGFRPFPTLSPTSLSLRRRSFADLSRTK